MARADAAVALPRPADRRGSLLSAAAVVFVGNLVARGLGFLFPLVLTHVASRRDFAAVYFFVNTGFFVGELVLTSYPTALTRYLAAEAGPGRQRRWVVGAVAGGLPLLVVSIGCGEALALAGHATAGLMAVVVAGLAVDAYYFGLLQGLQRFTLLVLYRVLANLAQLALLGAAVWAGVVGVPLAVAIYSLVYLIPILGIELVAAPIRSSLQGSGRPSRAEFLSLSRFALPSLVSGVAYAAILGLDVFFVRLLAPHSLADYGAARALVVPISFLPFAIGTVLFPRVAAAAEGDRRGLLGRSLRLTAAVSGLAVGGYVLLGPTVVGWVLPGSYAAAGGPLRWLAVPMGLLAVYSVLSQWWFGRGRPVPAALSLAAGALVGIGLQAVLIPAMGSDGAALAMAIAAAVALGLLGQRTLVELGRA